MLLSFCSIDYRYSMNNIAQSLDRIHKQIHAAEQKYGRNSGSVSLIAVTKNRSTTEVVAAMDYGQLDFGENYLQDGLTKIQVLNNPELIWHFIGSVQSNKTLAIAKHFNWVHSIDRLKIAQRLNDMRPDKLDALNICIEVNTSAETSKSGISPDELPDFVKSVMALPRLRLRGLMTMPMISNDFEPQRRPFRQLSHYFDRLNSKGYKLDTLSMGTTFDMHAAIAEGATMIRIGTAIFGARKANNK